jgi:magnesium-transporting ATPase (P-type)
MGFGQVESVQSSAPAYWAVVKGAPEVIQGFLASPHAEYEAAYKEYAAQGGRYECCVAHKPQKPSCMLFGAPRRFG